MSAPAIARSAPVRAMRLGGSLLAGGAGRPVTEGCTEHTCDGNQKGSRRRPIFPRSYPLSIFGAGELNFRVRDGNGCGLSAGVTRISCVWMLFGWTAANHEFGRDRSIFDLARVDAAPQGAVLPDTSH